MTRKKVPEQDQTLVCDLGRDCFTPSQAEVTAKTVGGGADGIFSRDLAHSVSGGLAVQADHRYDSNSIRSGPRQRGGGRLSARGVGQEVSERAAGMGVIRYKGHP